MMKSNNIEFAPLRSLDDFFLESARFQMPNLNDLDKWGNRVSSNLLYYQSNYILAAIIIIVIFTVLHPIQMVMGSILLGIIFFIFGVLLTHDNGILGQFKKNHPVISTLILFTVGYYLFGMLIGSLLIFLLAILVPFTAIFIHSSLRLRNIKNKLTNKVETLGFKQTPMGVFLSAMGQENFDALFKGTNLPIPKYK